MSSTWTEHLDKEKAECASEITDIIVSPHEEYEVEGPVFYPESLELFNGFSVSVSWTPKRNGLIKRIQQNTATGRERVPGGCKPNIVEYYTDAGLAETATRPDNAERDRSLP